MSVYEDMTNLASRFARSRPLPLDSPMPPGLLYDIEGAKDPQITFRLGTPLLGGGNTASEKWAGGSISTFLSGVAITLVEQIPWPPAFDVIKCPIPRLACIPQVKLIKNVALTPDPLFEKYALEKRGHVNAKSITPLGRVAIKEMMRLGMIIDIDHMSEKMANEVLRIATGLRYPVNSGHTTFRDHGGNNENKRTQRQLESLNALGGMLGVGWAGGTMANYLDNYRYGVNQKSLPNIGLTLGSDINGFEYMPKPRFEKTGKSVVAINNNPVIADTVNAINANAHPPAAIYNRKIEMDKSILDAWKNQVCYGAAPCMTKYKMTGSPKEWDFNVDGVAHIGLYPDAYQDLKNLGMTDKERKRFFGAADAFARMWDTIETRKALVH